VNVSPNRSSRVRLYAYTRGRTHARHPLLLESLVSTIDRPDPSGGGLLPESEEIVRLCAVPHAISEVAAELSMPLGIIRILVSDLVDQNLVYVHQTITGADPADSYVLKRALRGLERIFT